QACADVKIDARADVFSLGCLLYECITGRPAFDGKTVVEVLAKIVFDDPPPLTSLRGDVPAPLAALVASMLEKDVEKRPPDGQSVALALDRLGPLDATVRRPSERPIEITREEHRLLCFLFAVPASATPIDTTAPTLAHNNE